MMIFKRIKTFSLHAKLCMLLEIGICIVMLILFAVTYNLIFLSMIPIALLFLFFIYIGEWDKVLDKYHNSEWGMICNHCGYKVRHGEYDATEWDLFICPWCNAKDEDADEILVPKTGWIEQDMMKVVN